MLQLDRPGRRLPPFDGYEAIRLTYEQLSDLVANEAAHPDWRAALRAIGGVYLILAELTGDLYVGSATGIEGLWGRWAEYARSGHGGNMLLRQLINSDPASYPRRFTYSLLEPCPKTWAREKVLHREYFQNQRLGLRAHGLNTSRADEGME